MSGIVIKLIYGFLVLYGDLCHNKGLYLVIMEYLVNLSSKNGIYIGRIIENIWGCFLNGINIFYLSCS